MTVGSLAGSAIASMIFFLSGQSYITTFAAASVPPCLALAWLTVAFRKDLRPSQKAAAVPGPTRGGGSTREAAMVESKPALVSDEAVEQEEKQLSWLQKIKTVITAFSPAYWQALLVVSVLYFGRFDFTWVTLRAKAVRLHASFRERYCAYCNSSTIPCAYAQFRMHFRIPFCPSCCLKAIRYTCYTNRCEARSCQGGSPACDCVADSCSIT